MTATFLVSKRRSKILCHIEIILYSNSRLHSRRSWGLVIKGAEGGAEGSGTFAPKGPAEIKEIKEILRFALLCAACAGGTFLYFFYFYGTYIILCTVIKTLCLCISVFF